MRLIGIDWGTSSFRAFRFAEDGSLLATHSAARGILTVEGGKFAEALQGEIGSWLDGSPLLLSGMIGSRQGWIEAPYCPAPAGADEIAAACIDLPGFSGHIVPGVSTVRPDVMRGEETQILGTGIQDGLICTPGTHSKWVRVVGGRIVDFATHMTGELYAVLRQHSILGRLMEGDGEDEGAFLAGVATAKADPALGRTLFTARSYGLFEKVPASGLASYLSGLLIGTEIASEPGDGPVYLIATPALTKRYQAGLSVFGRTAQSIDGADAAAKGLWAIGQRLYGREG
ncbi:2-dehydro-3-deoxygalactonokinase [Lacibacterium aquatile]|uniref:2-dehydro-3-deoxygalactonokinase n=1 Tax=Lacibacterium aquatile TaxID=1168082 RepID=A0ABW5DSM1_9PROT